MSQKLRLFLGLGAFLIPAWLMIYQTRLLECVSESLQNIRYILVWKGMGFDRLDIVSIKDHHVHYTPETNFAKRVLGFPGDFITKNQDSLQIGSYVLPLLKQTKHGQSLNATSANIVPQGHVFVAGDHLRSFDSRYEEFGFVPFPKIWGRGILAW